jgi:hypothetical protein
MFIYHPSGLDNQHLWYMYHIEWNIFSLHIGFQSEYLVFYMFYQHNDNQAVRLIYSLRFMGKTYSMNTIPMSSTCAS